MVQEIDGKIVADDPVKCQECGYLLGVNELAPMDMETMEVQCPSCGGLMGEAGEL